MTSLNVLIAVMIVIVLVALWGLIVGYTLAAHLLVH